MFIFPKLKHRVNEITTRIAEVIFAEIKKLILTSIQKCEGPRIVKTILKKKENKIKGLILSGFMTFYKCYSNQDNMELS